MGSVVDRALDHELFRALHPDVRRNLSERFTVVELDAGEQLFGQGDPGDAMFVVGIGQLRVEVDDDAGRPISVTTLHPGDVVGEIAPLVGRPRNATVSAASPARVARLDASDFLSALDGHTDVIDQYAEKVAERIRQRGLAAIVASLPGIESDEDVRHFVEAAEWMHVSSGSPLFVQGDPADSIAVVVSGAFDVIVDEEERRHRIGRISRGELVGEMALLHGGRRSATLTAIRDSEVALIPADAFEMLSERYPSLALALVRNTASRLVDANQVVRPLKHESRATAFIPIDVEASRWLAEGVVGRLGDRAALLDRARFESAFGAAGSADVGVGDPANVAVVGWLSRFEREHDYVLYLGDASDTEWTQRCLRQSDRIYLVASASYDPEPRPFERRLAADICPERLQLVLVHEPEAKHPSGTHRWLDKRQVTRHHHVRRGDSAALGRLARRITGDTVAVVHGGGGARGFVHGGVARALDETNTPVDLVCGTSMGALVSAKVLLDGWDAFAEAASRFGERRQIIDYTLPLASLASSRRVTRLLGTLYGDTRIEDLWLPWFAVSTNLSQARVHIHDSGLLSDAVRASISIPGVFSPVSRNGDLVVDGGVMNNLPIDLARTVGGAGHVIAVNASPKRERSRRYEFDDHVSGWRLLGARLLPWVKTPRVPPLGLTVMRALDVNSVQRVRDLRPTADVLIAPDTSSYGVLQWEANAELIELGYQTAKAALAEHPFDPDM